MRYSPSANDISITFNILTQSTPYTCTHRRCGVSPHLKVGAFRRFLVKNLLDMAEPIIRTEHLSHTFDEVKAGR